MSYISTFGFSFTCLSFIRSTAFVSCDQVWSLCSFRAPLEFCRHLREFTAIESKVPQLSTVHTLRLRQNPSSDSFSIIYAFEEERGITSRCLLLGIGRKAGTLLNPIRNNRTKSEEARPRVENSSAVQRRRVYGSSSIFSSRRDSSSFRQRIG